jgi:hypothetical protein
LFHPSGFVPVSLAPPFLVPAHADRLCQSPLSCLRSGAPTLILGSSRSGAAHGEDEDLLAGWLAYPETNK